MSTNSESPDGDRMTKIDGRVLQSLLDTTEEEYAECGYTSQSEAIRDALLTWVDPPIQLTDETLGSLATSYEQAEWGEIYSEE